MVASMSSSFFLISLSVATICWLTLDPFPLGSLLSFFAEDVRLPIMFSLVVRRSLRCANLVGARAGVDGRDHVLFRDSAAHRLRCRPPTTLPQLSRGWRRP